MGRATFVGMDGSHLERYFVNVLSAGLGGLVDRYIDTMPAFLGGRVGYYLAALRAVIVSKERPVQARITWRDERREEVVPAYLVAICNGRWFGGGMDVAPMALLDDGRMEVVTITAPSKPYLADRVRASTPVVTSRSLPCTTFPATVSSCCSRTRPPSVASFSMSTVRHSARSRSPWRWRQDDCACGRSSCVPM